MKKETNEFFKQTGKVEIDKLSAASFPEVSNGVHSTGSKIFTVADMWNIHARAKNAIPRRWAL